MIKYELFLRLVPFFVFAVSSIGYSQPANFEDGFEDGNFKANPPWSGGSSDFVVIHDAPNVLLRLNGDDSNGGVSYLSTPSTNIIGYWEFYINLEFAPSGSNYTTIFLMSDIADLEGPVNGYALRAGEGGSNDVFRIVRYDNGSEAATVLSGTTDISGGGPFRVKVTRKASGQWSLEAAKKYDGNLAPEGDSQIDSVHTSANYFGLRTTYTASRADLFTFDFKIDLPPFSVAKVAAGRNYADVYFNRPYDSSTVQTTDFEINKGLGSPVSVGFPAPDIIRLTYDNAFISDEYVLTVRNVADQNGSAIEEDASALFTVFGDYDPSDLVVNEFMYDPPAGLSEYIEIKNRSNKFLNLQNWRISDDSDTTIISTDPLALRPRDFLVISKDTSTLGMTYGPGPYVESPTLPALNNSGDVVQLLTDAGRTVDSLSYQPDWGGDKAALERRSDTVLAVYRENWGKSPAPDGGTPGTGNQVAKDERPPRLTDLTILTDTQLVLRFTERLDFTAGNPNQYTITGNSISSAKQTMSDTVELNLNDPLRNARDYRLTITNVQDVFGNAIGSSDTTFIYYEITTADSGDVFINEFSYDPAPGQTEYVEIYNPANQSFDLKNWTLSDNRGERAIITEQSHILPPEKYVVLTPDNTLLQSHPDIALISMGNRFPALNNSGDDLILKNASGRTLDTLRFTADWGGAEKPLERRSTAIAGTFKENWGDAPQTDDSAGRENTISEDTTAPKVEAAYAVSGSKIQLLLSERITPSSATNFANYHLSSGRNIQLISAQSDSVTLFLSDPLISGHSYTLTAENLADIFGNESTSSVHSIEFLKLSEAQPGDVIINEIMADPDASGAEFVELYNLTNKNIDLSNWTLGDAADETKLPGDSQLRANSYLVLTGSFSFAQSQPRAIMLPGFPNLNNAGDALFIRGGKKGPTIDSLYYRSAWGNGLGGSSSLERKDPQAASNDSSNWAGHNSSTKNSAGFQNSNFGEDTTPPSVLFAYMRADGRVEIRFNEFVHRTEELRFSSNGSDLPITSFEPANGNIITLQYSNSGPKKTTISVHNLSDIRGNETPETGILLSHPLRNGDLVINEIMYNPLDEDDDNKPDQSEYIELYNTRDYALSLEGLTLHDTPDEDGKVRTLQPVSTSGKWVRPQNAILVYADQSLAFNQSKLASFFELNPDHFQDFIQVDENSLSLASAGDAIYIADSTGAVIDSVHYDEEWHNPNLIDTRGIALERITPGGASNQPANWSSSVHPKGGTPKAQNSIFQKYPEPSHEAGISFAPNPFSPDGDGHEDNLIISYRLDQPDYLLRVNIYDRYGRHIKELVDGTPAGFEGQLIWDGRRDDGRRNRIGIYIIVFEAINSASGSDKAFKKTVVIARKLN